MQKEHARPVPFCLTKKIALSVPFDKKILTGFIIQIESALIEGSNANFTIKFNLVKFSLVKFKRIINLGVLQGVITG